MLRTFFKFVLVYDSFILKLSISISISTALLFCCGDNVKYGLLSKHVFQRKRQYGVEKISQ